MAKKQIIRKGDITSVYIGDNIQLHLKSKSNFIQLSDGIDTVTLTHKEFSEAVEIIKEFKSKEVSNG
jgi:hypothetical protein